MYYHHRELQHVEYGKVGPAPVEALDPDLARAYRWLGQYCGFYPQVWLARSTSSITGFSTTYQGALAHDHGVLFGFKDVQGFPLAYDPWFEIMITVNRCETLDEANKAVQEHLEDEDLQDEPMQRTWRETRDVQDVLSKHVFVLHDQVVVPRLNLKAAKQITCRDERQKRSLRRMGFIEDRLVIRGPRPRQRPW